MKSENFKIRGGTRLAHNTTPCEPSHPSARKKWLLLFLAGVFSLCACGGENRALDRIKKSGTITAITHNNAHCYYIYQDQHMGFEYDLAKAFADYLGVKLKVKVCKSRHELLPALAKGEGDFVAASMTMLPSRLKQADFSKEYLVVRQMVITNKDNLYIKSIDDLNKKTVHLRGETGCEESLKRLKQNGIDITIRVHHDAPIEKLIKDVAEGKIEITVADANVALLNRRYYPDIRIAFPLDEAPRPHGWAVRKGEKALLDEINTFFDKIKQDGTFDDIYKRYYPYVEKFDHFDIKMFQKRIQRRLPKYEPIIRKASKTYGFDWRLVAALIYQESQFNPLAKSFTGVKGLMQLTLPTAQEMGIENRLDPEQSIMGGVRYLRKLYNRYDKADGLNRLLIALAAYNVGRGHILDAQRLALKMNLDPYKWSSLEKTLPLLRQARYYKNSWFGYCRGTEPVSHVQSVLTYYDILKRQSIEYPIKDHT
ncbi:MAG: membrane-bound lytic murein transglycosylase MltF [Deltaproteobacteria bacterium]|nr:membrane-bound lytic murein transglycosylase MltF [Deltaproteobacteria bacterium]MBW2075568.1 membrane-bound lytic murein transglycosylase MltF [Deltaproteobacteria bacterium]